MSYDENRISDQIDGGLLLNKQYEEAIKRVDDAYYDRHSPHYMDNDRYRWAIESINNHFGINKTDNNENA